MGVISVKCDCGKVVSASVDETIYDNEFRWYITYHCNWCSSSMEMDDFGIEGFPEYLRQAVIEKDGEWGIAVTDDKSLSKINYVLRKSIGNLERYTTSCEKCILKGTCNEMKWIEKILKDKGIDGISLKKL